MEHIVYLSTGKDKEFAAAFAKEEQEPPIEGCIEFDTSDEKTLVKEIARHGFSEEEFRDFLTDFIFENIFEKSLDMLCQHFGQMLLYGQGVYQMPHDTPLAGHVLERLASKNLPEAKYYLAISMIEGLYVSEIYDAPIVLLSEASESGHGDSTATIANLIQPPEGEDIESVLSEKAKMLGVATEQGSGFGAYCFAELLQRHTDFFNMPVEKIELFYSVACRSGYFNAFSALGELYLHQDQVPEFLARSLMTLGAYSGVAECINRFIYASLNFPEVMKTETVHILAWSKIVSEEGSKDSRYSQVARVCYQGRDHDQIGKLEAESNWLARKIKNQLHVLPIMMEHMNDEQKISWEPPELFDLLCKTLKDLDDKIAVTTMSREDIVPVVKENLKQLGIRKVGLTKGV